MQVDDGRADVSICVCTFRRPDQLSGLLDALLSQSALARVLEIVVVDNDPLRSAKPVLDRRAGRSVVPVVALSCEEPNISLARNMAVHNARGQWIAFIDDDEVPVRTWLESLLDLSGRLAADAVFGPVVAVYGDRIPDWVVRGRFFDRRRLPTGSEVTRHDVRSGNVLVRRDLLLSLPGPFDAAFGKTGGEDTLLFTWLLQRGHVRFVWCDEAVVHEPVEPSRATVRWLLMRSYRGGQSFVLVTMKTARRERRLAALGYVLSRALVQLCVAGVLAMLYSPVNRAQSFKWLRVFCAQCGKMAGAMGSHYQEYRRE